MITPGIAAALLQIDDLAKMRRARFSSPSNKILILKGRSRALCLQRIERRDSHHTRFVIEAPRVDAPLELISPLAGSVTICPPLSRGPSASRLKRRRSGPGL
jgi:hypothetical protein